jgi:hypothetical protein
MSKTPRKASTAKDKVTKLGKKADGSTSGPKIGPKIYSGRSGAVGRVGDSNYIQRPAGSLVAGEKTTVRSGPASSATYYSPDRKSSLITPDKKRPAGGPMKFLKNQKAK